ncbi:MAG: HAD family hydrolase [Spirochaetaceae bacterium]|nr:HAD family hydrolase [Spirochaetaceae bacterium]
MIYKAIIFDLDGTLIDTISDIRFYINSVLKRHSFPEVSLNDTYSLVGGGLRDAMKTALAGAEKNEKNIDLYEKELIEEYFKHPIIDTHPYKEIDVILEKIKEKKIKTAIFSNKAHSITEKIVNTLFGREMFDIVRGCMEGVPKKPNPAGALMIAEKLGFSPKEIIYIGDSDTDCITANRGGFKFIAALWGYRTKKEIANAGADLFISKPMELLDFLE